MSSFTDWWRLEPRAKALWQGDFRSTLWNDQRVVQHLSWVYLRWFWYFSSGKYTRAGESVFFCGCRKSASKYSASTCINKAVPIYYMYGHCHICYYYYFIFVVTIIIIIIVIIIFFFFISSSSSSSRSSCSSSSSISSSSSSSSSRSSSSSSSSRSLNRKS